MLAGSLPRGPGTVPPRCRARPFGGSTALSGETGSVDVRVQVPVSSHRPPCWKASQAAVAECSTDGRS